MHNYLYTMQLHTDHTQIRDPNVMKYTTLSHIDCSQVQVQSIQENAVYLQMHDIIAYRS